MEHMNGDDFVFDFVRYWVEESVWLNKALGAKLESVTSDTVCLEFSLPDNLVSDTNLRQANDGLIAAMLNISGSAAALSSLLGSIDEKARRHSAAKKGIESIDFRVDHMAPPARGNAFNTVATVVSVNRGMRFVSAQLRDSEHSVVSAGTGTYCDN